MANGTQTTSGSKIQFKPRKLATEIQPDAPEGGWEATIPKGKSKIFQTAADKGGDPGVSIAFKLEKANEEANEPFQGSIVNQRVTFYDQADPDRRKAANMNLQFMRNMCEAMDIEFDEVYPANLTSPDDLAPFLNAIEGQKVDIWTVHRNSVMGNGESVINVDIRFKKPGAGLVSKDADEDDERPGKKPAKAAAGKRR